MADPSVQDLKKLIDETLDERLSAAEATRVNLQERSVRVKGGNLQERSVKL